MYFPRKQKKWRISFPSATLFNANPMLLYRTFVLKPNLTKTFHIIICHNMNNLVSLYDLHECESNISLYIVNGNKMLDLSNYYFNATNFWQKYWLMPILPNMFVFRNYTQIRQNNDRFSDYSYPSWVEKLTQVSKITMLTTS